MEIQRHCHHPNQPPHFAKCDGNLTLKSGLYDQCPKNQTPPRFPSLFTQGGQPPLSSSYSFGINVTVSVSSALRSSFVVFICLLRSDCLVQSKCHYLFIWIHCKYILSIVKPTQLTYLKWRKLCTCSDEIYWLPGYPIRADSPPVINYSCCNISLFLLWI